MAESILLRVVRDDVPLQLTVSACLALLALQTFAPAAASAGLVVAFLLLALAAAVLVDAARSAAVRSGRLFWHGAAAMLLLSAAAHGLGRFLPAASLRIEAALAIDALFAAACAVLTLATDLRPDLGGPPEPRELDERLGARSAALVVAALFVYGAVIPAVVDPAAFLAERGSSLLRLCLDLFLLSRFAHLSLAAGSLRWRVVYQFFSASFLAAAAVEVWRLADPLAAGRVPSLAWAPPLLLVVAAARASRLVLPARSVQELASEESRGWEPLTFYGIALPFLHLVFDFYGQLGPRARAPQEGFVLVYFVAFGALALLQSWRREKKRRRAEEALRESEERYRQLIEAYPDAILIEQGGELVYVNATGVEKFGFEIDDDPARHRPQPHRSFAALGFPPRPAGEERTLIPIDCRVAGKDGEEMVLEVSYYDISYRGQRACQAVARDMTEAKRLRAHSERTQRLAWLGQFSAALAHEIRNPLAAIVMHGFFLSQRLADDEENLRTLADINTAVERMQKLVNGILAFVRPPTLRLVPEDLVAVLDSARLELQRQTSLDQIEVVESYNHLTATVEVDVNQMVSAFTHILDNGVRAMPSGGVLTLATSNPTPDSIEVVIEDTGDGICDEDRERLFEPFFSRRDDGVGLGLALVARILDQHDCRYRVESVPRGEGGRGGTRFVLDFPLLEPLDEVH